MSDQIFWNYLCCLRNTVSNKRLFFMLLYWEWAVKHSIFFDVSCFLLTSLNLLAEEDKHHSAPKLVISCVFSVCLGISCGQWHYMPKRTSSPNMQLAGEDIGHLLCRNIASPVINAFASPGGHERVQNTWRECVE